MLVTSHGSAHPPDSREADSHAPAIHAAGAAYPVAEESAPKADPNILTSLGIDRALVLAIYGYTFYSVSQESFLDELEVEAKAAGA